MVAATYPPGGRGCLMRSHPGLPTMLSLGMTFKHQGSGSVWAPEGTGRSQLLDIHGQVNPRSS